MQLYLNILMYGKNNVFQRGLFMLFQQIFKIIIWYWIHTIEYFHCYFFYIDVGTI